jgi:hypothetical protein
VVRLGQVRTPVVPVGYLPASQVRFTSTMLDHQNPRQADNVLLFFFSTSLQTIELTTRASLLHRYELQIPYCLLIAQSARQDRYHCQNRRGQTLGSSHEYYVVAPIVLFRATVAQPTGPDMAAEKRNCTQSNCANSHFQDPRPRRTYLVDRSPPRHLIGQRKAAGNRFRSILPRQVDQSRRS